MNEWLDLGRIRNVLTRLEETIIFGLIERAQFCRNAIVYRKGAFGPELEGESLVGFLLHEAERSHAKVRRYTSPDEVPFFDDLPAPILPALSFDDPLRPNSVNFNARIRDLYEIEIVPFICPPGDDGQYGSSAVNDVSLLPSLSKRIHYGKFVAESKFRRDPERIAEAIRADDAGGLMEAITDPEVEESVRRRVRLKARTYGQQLDSATPGFKVDPNAVEDIYTRWIVPLNKEVQVAYLRQRGTAR